MELPELTDNISLTIIRGLTASELLGEIIKIGNGVALHEQTLDDIMTISEQLSETTSQAFEIVLDSLLENLRPQVEGKTILIPSCMNYALPSSEKQFAGSFPVGSYVTTPKDTVFGIHWFN